MPIMKKKASAQKAPKAEKVKKETAAPKKAEKKPAAKPRVISSEERFQMIQTAAYYRAQACGFQGDPKTHWAEAEKEVNKLLGC